jgi:hypothetical protein
MSTDLFICREKSSFLQFSAVRTECMYVGSEVLTAVVMKSTIFWDITPCSPLTVRRNMSPTSACHPAFTLVSCSAYSSILKMEATCSFETSVDFQQTTRRYILEDSTLLSVCSVFRRE